jgi:hypothetical protein
MSGAVLGWLALAIAAVAGVSLAWRKLRALSSEEAEAARRRDPVYALLRRELDRIGPEFEARPYDALCAGAEALSFSRTVDGVEIHFSAEAFDQLPNGDMAFCIDASARPNRTGVQPSYRFFKRRDGSVYH